MEAATRKRQMNLFYSLTFCMVLYAFFPSSLCNNTSKNVFHLLSGQRNIYICACVCVFFFSCHAFWVFAKFYQICCNNTQSIDVETFMSEIFSSCCQFLKPRKIFLKQICKSTDLVLIIWDIWTGKFRACLQNKIKKQVIQENISVIWPKNRQTDVYTCIVHECVRYTWVT